MDAGLESKKTESSLWLFPEQGVSVLHEVLRDLFLNPGLGQLGGHRARKAHFRDWPL